ncbi:MAG: hypothetical protein HY822_01640 [Acidobacteria bacterium]|nr:hypothetical protein [Acidobacteriota bacterium]
MPEIKLSDQFGLDLNVVPNPDSAITKYFREAADVVANGFDFSRASGLTLADPAVTSFQTGLNFNRPLEIGDDVAKLKVSAGLSGTCEFVVPGPERSALFAPDQYGDNIALAAEDRYVSLSLKASAGTKATTRAGKLSFGFEPGASIEIVNYRKFSTQPSPPSIASALKETFAAFSLPGDVDDLAALAEGSVAVLNGRGTLRVKCSANLLALANPLASLSLPLGAGELSVAAGGSVTVGASVRITGEYQIRARKLGANRVRLGYYKKRATETIVEASAGAGLTAGAGDFEIYPAVLEALSSDPKTDRAALQQAGLPADRIAAIEGAVKAGLERKLELAVHAELGTLDSTQAAFLYEIDLDRLDAAGRDAVHLALGGDLSGLDRDEGAALAGVTCLRSIGTALHQRRLSLKVNLLGIYSFISVSKLTLSGRVVYEPVTGDLTIADTATADRIQAARAPFLAEPERLRKVLAESFLITAAYRCGKSVASAPALKSAHTFFEMNARTNRQMFGDDLEVAVALGVLSQAEQERLLGALNDFGSTAFYAETRYDDERTAALFLDRGRPSPIEEYERAGREAIQLLVRPGDIDEYRRRPAIDDTLWNRMKPAGQFNLKPLFPDLTGQQVGVLGADYSVIVWWAGTMHKTAQKLAELRALVEANPSLSADDPRFRSLRDDLAKHLEKVARDTKEEFGRPWGLIAMDRVSGRTAEATVQITGPRVALLKERAKALAQTLSGTT